MRGRGDWAEGKGKWESVEGEGGSVEGGFADCGGGTLEAGKEFAFVTQPQVTVTLVGTYCNIYIHIYTYTYIYRVCASLICFVSQESSVVVDFLRNVFSR